MSGAPTDGPTVGHSFTIAVGESASGWRLELSFRTSEDWAGLLPVLEVHRNSEGGGGGSSSLWPPYVDGLNAPSASVGFGIAAGSRVRSSLGEVEHLHPPHLPQFAFFVCEMRFQTLQQLALTPLDAAHLEFELVAADPLSGP